MSKRRFRADAEEERPPEQLSPEERRAQRRAERGGKGRRPKEPRTGWRRAVVPGAVLATVLVVALVLWFGVGLLFPHPCLSFTAIPTTSGPPNFPNATTIDFSGTWCPTATPLFSIHPQLSIVINGGSVALPNAIGRSGNFTGHPCNLPLLTVPGLGAGIFNVTSPWAYDYSLGNFFTVWQESYVSAHVNASYNTRTIDYTANQLLGLPVDASHTLSLYVDNQLSTAGPGLILNGLNYVPGSTPSCIDSVYGTGHTITLVYKSSGAGALVPTAPPAPHATALHGPPPAVEPRAYPGSSSPRGPVPATPPWLVMRCAP